MDKSWILLEDRRLPQYENGVDTFLDFAYSSIESSKEIRCPCRKCNNVYFKTRDDVEGDLYENGILKSYTAWIFHGEKFDDSIFEEFDLDKEDKSDYVDLDESTRSDIHGNQNDYVNMQNILEDSFAATATNAWGEKPNRLRGYGDGLKPPSDRKERINVELQKENENLRNELKQNKEEMEALRTKNTEISLRLESLEAKIPEIYRALTK